MTLSYEHGAPALTVSETVNVFSDRHDVGFDLAYYLFCCCMPEEGGDISVKIYTYEFKSKGSKRSCQLALDI